MARRIRKPGEFCWINMLTPQPSKARDFFAELFGWTFVEMPQFAGYSIKLAGSDMGAMYDVNGPQTPKGTPPHIGVMVKVQSADATAEKFKSLGGSVKFAMDIGQNLRIACCVDPDGAGIDLWEPKTAHGSDVDGGEHGAINWFELITRDPVRAAKFYGGVFGWTTQAMPSPGIDYTVFNLDGAGVAGMLKMKPEMGSMPQQWATYFTVRDAEQSARDAVKLGGKVCMPMKQVPQVGKIVGIQSPQGVWFYIIQHIM
jgi:predicted enzyme related to lactoylglutathione lyase